MDAEELQRELCQAKGREDRYRWVISIILVITSIVGGFMGGMLFEMERSRDQIVTNSVEIKSMKDVLRDMNEKLDYMVAAQKTCN